jgi:hypothetical protein
VVPTGASLRPRPSRQRPNAPRDLAGTEDYFPIALANRLSARCEIEDEAVVEYGAEILRDFEEQER